MTFARFPAAPSKSVRVLSASVLALAVLVFTSPAQAGFEWTPPKNLPSIQKAAPAPVENPIAAAPTTPVESAMPDMGPLSTPATPPQIQQPGMSTINLLQKAEAQKMDLDSSPLTPLPGEAAVPPQIQQPEPLAMSAAPESIAPENDVMVMDQAAPVSVLPEQQPVQPETISWNAQTAQPAQPMQPAVSPAVSNADAEKIVDGFGSDIPLVMAMRQIVPASYAYQFQNKADAGSKISWDGANRPWAVVLDQALQPLGLKAFVNGNRVVIASVSGMAPMAQAPQPMPLMQDSGYADMGAATAAPVAMMEQSAPEAQQPVAATKTLSRGVHMWEARPGTTLQEVLNDWGYQGGYEMDWQTPYDYPIANAFRFEGTVDQAVDAILSLYAQDQPKPRGKLYPNLPEGPSVLLIN